MIAFGILAWLVDGYDAIFVLSFSLAAVGVAVLVFFVPGAPPRAASGNAPVPNAKKPQVKEKKRLRRALREFAGLAGDVRYRRLLGVGAVLSLTTISDGFIYLTLNDRVGMGAVLFPLLFVGTAAAYLVLAVPLGRLADRIGRVQVFLGGHAVAALGYLGLWLLPAGPALVIGVLALIGTYYAATDGVLPALTAPLVPENLRTTGIAGVQTVMAVGGMLSAVLFGIVWSQFGQLTAVALFAAGLAAAIGLATRLLLERPAGRITR